MFYPAPFWNLSSWLIQPRTNVPEVVEGLRSTLFRRMSSLVAAAFCGLAIVGVALYRHPTLPFLSWAIVDSTLVVTRLAIVTVLLRMMAQGGRAGPACIVDVFLGSSLLWCLQIGLGSFLCMASGDLVLAVFAALVSMGVVGAACSRNPGAPRLTTLQMLLVVVPLSLGALLNPAPPIHLVALMAPAYLWGCMSISQQLHNDYINMLAAEQRVRHFALHCGLTGLPNRSHFNDQLGATLRDTSEHPVYVLCLDLDGFKFVNDTHGHYAGDMLLQQVAERLIYCTSTTSLASRLGGDEFAVFTRQQSREDVHILAALLISEISRPYMLPDEIVIKIGVSIGLSRQHGDIVDPVILLVQADKALYVAKRAGKGVCKDYEAGA